MDAGSSDGASDGSTDGATTMDAGSSDGASGGTTDDTTTMDAGSSDGTNDGTTDGTTTTDAGSSGPILECMDNDASNYSAAAEQDDGSCSYAITFEIDGVSDCGFVSVTGTWSPHKTILAHKRFSDTPGLSIIFGVTDAILI